MVPSDSEFSTSRLRGVAGAAIAYRRRQPWWLFAAPAIAVTVTAMATYGIPRFRLPAEVAFVVAAAITVCAAVARLAPPAIATRLGLQPPRRAPRQDAP